MDIKLLPAKALQSKIIYVFQGAENARILSIVTTVLAFCEYFSSLDEEVQFFWSGPWTLSRFLFLLNRYLSLAVQIFDIAGLMSVFTGAACVPALKTAFHLNAIAITVIQAILVLRVWYLFSYSTRMRVIAVVAFLLSIGFSTFSLNDVTSSIRMVSLPGCHVFPPKKFHHIYLPSLVLHTILYILTAYRALRNRRILKEAPMLQRLLRDGGLFYFVVFGTTVYSTVGSLLINVPTVNLPAIFSHLMLSVASMCISRIMLSTHSLASNLGSDTAWLLNNIELSRVNWKMGAHEGELIVDLSSRDEEEVDGKYSIGQITMTRVAGAGLYHQSPLDLER